MATKLWLHQQHPSSLVSALSQISEIARLKCKCTGTARHQHVPRDVPMDSLGLAKKSQDAVRLSGMGPTTCYLISGRSRCRQSPTALTLTGLQLRGLLEGQKVQDAGQCHGTRGVWQDGTLRTLISFLDRCAQPHSVALAGISLKGAESELFCISAATLPGEHPPSAWFCQPDPVGLALMKPRLNSVQSYM